MATTREIYEKLYRIYNRHRRGYRENRCDSQQMCLMWSTDDPPDDIMETEPLEDLEAAFGIDIEEDDALELYDMTLKQTAGKIARMQKARQLKTDRGK